MRYLANSTRRTQLLPVQPSTLQCTFPFLVQSESVVNLFTSAVFLLSLYFPFLLILITFLLQLNLAPIPKYLATGMRQCYCADFSPRELAGFYAELSPRLCLFGQSRGEVFFFRVSSDGELLEQERYRKKLSRAKEAVARNNKRNGACVCVLYIYVEITDIAF